MNWNLRLPAPLRWLAPFLAWLAARTGTPLSLTCALRLANYRMNRTTMDRLGQLYRDYGLPLPPEDTPLVRLRGNGGIRDEKGEVVPLYEYGFWLNHTALDHPPELLLGPVTVRMDPRDQRRPEPVGPEDLPPTIVPLAGRGESFEYNGALATAIQCHARGLTKFAARLAEVALGSESPGGGPAMMRSDGPWLDARENRVDFHGGNDLTPERILAGLAWNHCLNELGRPLSDWRTVAPRLRYLLATDPVLAGARQRVVEAVEAALRPRTSPPGSVEALIDDLVDLALPPHGLGPRESAEGLTPPERSYLELQARSFEAVPALIAHLGDERMTRSRTAAFNNFRPIPLHVGDLASQLLQEIAGQPLGKDWLAIRVGQRVEKAEAEAWWQTAQAAGEESRMVAQAIGPEQIHEPAVLALERKYPHRLGEVYRKALEGTAHTAPLARAIGRAKLEPTLKMEWLALGLSSPSRDHQHWALREVQKLESTRADEELLARLREFPATASGPLWTSPEARISLLVLRSSSQGVWDALLAATRRAEVGLRVELMGTLLHVRAEAQRPRVLAFLAAFLNDETVRTKSGRRFSGPCAGFHFPAISVRDFAAMELSRLFGGTVRPDKDWTAAQWAALRAEASARLAAQP